MAGLNDWETAAERMARKHSGTIEFTQKTVGTGGHNDRGDVDTVQELLHSVGELSAAGMAGGWGRQSAAALQSFRTKYGTGAQRSAACLEPNDELLLLMAQKADVLIPLSGFSGFAGVTETHKWFESNGIRYNPGAERGQGNRAIWGVHGNRSFAVQTIGGRLGRGPVEMDCTIYVNLMISIYLTGDAHGDRYTADCSPFGGISHRHLARERYGFPLIYRRVGGQTLNYCSSAADITEATRTAPASLYVLEVGGAAQGGVTHMALLQGARVYECTIGQPGSACIARSLEEFMRTKGGKPIYLFGPR